MRSPLFFPLSCCILRASPMTKVQFGYASLTAAVCFSFLSFCAGSASPKSNAIAHWAECTEKRTEVLLMLLPDCALTEADQLKLAAAPSPSGLLVCLPWPLGRSKRKRVSSWLFCCSSPFRCLFIESNVLVCVLCCTTSHQWVNSAVLLFLKLKLGHHSRDAPRDGLHLGHTHSLVLDASA